MDPEGLNELGEAIKLAAAEQQKLNDAAKQGNSIFKENEVLVGELEATLKEAKAEQAALNQQLTDANLNLRERLDIEEDLINIKRQEIKADIALRQLRGEETKELIRQEKVLRLRGRYFNQIDSTTQNIASNVGLSFKYENSFLKAIMSSNEEVEGVENGFGRVLTNLKGLLSPQEISYSLVTKIFEETKKYNMELMAAGKNLNKNTAMSAKFAGDLDSAAHTFFLYGASLEDAAGNIGTLVSGFNDFTSINKKERTNLLKLSAQMNAIGISTDDFASALNYLTKVQGKSVVESAKFTKELAEYGASIGRVPSEFVKEFVSATDKLSIYGDRMGDIFERLQERAKGTGVSFDTLLAATDKFRDFSEVTKMIAALNAQLGRINLDPLEFLKMDDPDQQLRALREAIVASGQLERIRADSAERALLAQTTGFSDADLMKMLNGEFEETNRQNADFNKLLEKSSDIMDKLGTIARALAINFMPVLEYVDEFLAGITESKNVAREFMKETARSFVKISLFGGAILKTFFAAKKHFLGLAGVIGDIIYKIAMFAKGGAKVSAAIAPMLTFTKFIAKKFAPIAALFSAFETIPKFLDAFSSAQNPVIKFFTVIIGLAQIILDVFFNPFIELFNMLGGDAGRLNLFSGMEGGDFFTKAHNGTTGYGGGPLMMKQDEVMTNVPSGTSVLTRGNSQTIETLLRDLNNSINKLGAGGGTGGKPVEVVLKLDGKVLSRQVMKELKYSV